MAAHEAADIEPVDDELVADFSHQLHPGGIRTITWLLEPPAASGVDDKAGDEPATSSSWPPRVSASEPIVRPAKHRIEELDLTHNNLRSLDGIEEFSSLRVLCLRQNLLTALEPLGGCASTLQSLDVYLNNLRAVTPDWQLELPRLLHFDGSYNKIADLSGLERWTTLRTLYLASNRIAELPPPVFTALPRLRVLELGNNRLRSVDPAALSNLPALEELFLGKNKITDTAGLAQLTSLTRLDLQSNRITALGHGLRNLTGLRELYLAHNGLQHIDDGLRTLTRLECLDMSANMIAQLDNLDTLVGLHEFWFSSNKVASFAEVERLRHAAKLHTVYFEHNPIATDPQYRARLGLILPTLTQIDADLAYPDKSVIARATKQIENQQ